MNNRVAEYRARMRQRGYKEVRYWVPDTGSAEFVRRIRDECLALNKADARDDTAAFLDEVQDELLTAYGD